MISTTGSYILHDIFIAAVVRRCLRSPLSETLLRVLTEPFLVTSRPNHSRTKNNLVFSCACGCNKSTIIGRSQPLETPITIEKCANSHGRTKEANERSFGYAFFFWGGGGGGEE